MKKIKLLLSTLLGCFLMTSCYVTKEVSLEPNYNLTFKGRSHNEIVTQLGAPNRETTDGANGTILIYEHTEYRNIATAENYNYITGTYTPGSRTYSKTIYLHFYIDKDGICYGVKTNLTTTVTEKITNTETEKKELTKKEKSNCFIAAGIGILCIVGVLLGDYYLWG